jgi:hypothetical protein
VLAAAAQAVPESLACHSIWSWQQMLGWAYNATAQPAIGYSARMTLFVSSSGDVRKTLRIGMFFGTTWPVQRICPMRISCASKYLDLLRRVWQRRCQPGLHDDGTVLQTSAFRQRQRTFEAYPYSVQGVKHQRNWAIRCRTVDSLAPCPHFNAQ